jgi:hypothetical protein
LAKNLRGQGSRLSTGQAKGCAHAPEEAAPSPTVGFRVMMMMMFTTIIARD